MSTSAFERPGGVNDEAIRAWDGPLYDRFVRFRKIVTSGLGASCGDGGGECWGCT